MAAMMVVNSVLPMAVKLVVKMVGSLDCLAMKVVVKMAEKMIE